MAIELSIPEEDNIDTKAKTARKSRAVNERETKQRVYYETDSWLTIPEHVEQEFQNQGYKLGWLRIYLNGEEDYKAVGKKINEGWEFVTADEVPDMTIGYGYHKANDRFANTIVRGDVALAKIPEDIWLSQKQRGLDRNREMNDAINARLNALQDRRMPISNESRSRVTVGAKPTSFDRG